RQPRIGRKPQRPRSNGLPAPRPSSIRVHRKCAHCAKEYLAAMGRSPSRNDSLSPEGRAAVAQDRAKPGESTSLADHDDELMDIQVPQVWSSTTPEIVKNTSV